MSAVQELLASTPQNSKFLSLPGEIRNHIYSFCSESINVVPGFREAERSVSHATHGVYSGRHYSWGTDRWNIEQGVYLRHSATYFDYYLTNGFQRAHTYTNMRQFFGLTQVCQQVRQEYGSLYRRVLPVNIWFPDLPGFINAFYPLGQSKEIMQRYEGKITIQVPWAVESWIDLTPLLKLCRHAPLVQVHFDSAFVEPEIIKDLNHLFSPSSPQPYIKRSGSWYCVGMERVRYPRLHSVYVHFFDRWMCWDPTLKLIFDKNDSRQWMSSPKLRFFQFGGGKECMLKNVNAPELHIEEATAIANKLGLGGCKCPWLVEIEVDEAVDWTCDLGTIGASDTAGCQARGANKGAG